MIEIDYLKVGQHLKKLRSELGITQDQVAKDLGCTVAFVSNVEHNRAKMNSSCDPRTMAELCSVSVDSILAAGPPGRLSFGAEPVAGSGSAGRLPHVSGRGTAAPD